MRTNAICRCTQPAFEKQSRRLRAEHCRSICCSRIHFLSRNSELHWMRHTSARKDSTKHSSCMAELRGNKNGNRPRLGFLGTGWIGLDRMQRIAESGFADVALICDSSPHVFAQAVKVAPSARLTNSYEELLSAGLDGVVIATPSALHAEQAIHALENGLPVF